MIQNPFADLIPPQGAAPPSPSSPASGRIYGNPRQPPPVRPEVVEGDVLRNADLRRDLENAPTEEALRRAQLRKATADAAVAEREAADAPDPEQARRAARSSALGMLDTIRRARETTSGWSTGLGQQAFGEWGGTDARDLRGLVSTLQANLAFDRLQQMREASKTGGALGAISERELELLGSTVANLDPSQGRRQFLENLEGVERHFMRAMLALNGVEPPEDPQALRAMFAEQERQTPRPAAEERVPGRAQVEIVLGDEAPPPPAGEVFLGWGEGPNGERVPRYGPPPERTDAGYMDRALDRVGAIPVVGTAATAARALFGDEAALAGVRGGLDVGTLGTVDEIGAGIRTLGGGTFSENLGRERAIDQYDEQHNFVPRTVGQIAAGFALPAGAARTAGQLARVGAGYGGAYGFGSGEGSVADRLMAAGSGSIVGAGVGAGVGAAVNRFTRGRSGGDNGGRVAPHELIEAAANLGIDVLPADVGGPFTRRLTAAAAQSPISAGAVIRAGQRTVDQSSEALGGIAAREGAPVRQEVLGDTIRGAATRFNEESGAYGREVYRGAREMSDDQLFQGRQAFQNLNAQIRELQQTPNTSAELVTGLSRLRDDIAGDNGLTSLPIDAIRRLRTNVRSEAATEGLRGTDYQRRARQVLDDLSSDIVAQLPDDAAAEFRRADRLWRERLDFIDDIEANLLGPKDQRSAEDVTRRLTNWSRSDSARFRTFMNTVNQEEAGIIRGSLIQELGRARSGSQGASGQGFSLETFLSNWDNLPERARNVLFRGDSRAAIEDLARVAEGARASATYANRSNTGGVAITGGLVGGSALLSPWMLPIIGGNYLSGRLLASPRFARWLARPPQDRGRAMRRLAQIAAREPALAPEINIIQRVLEPNTRRAAATGESSEDSR